jgi:hypothetical protein
VLQKYVHVFHDEETSDSKSTHVIEHQTLLEDIKSIRRPQYKTPFTRTDEMKAQVKFILAKGVIRERSYNWSASAILVPNMSFDGKKKFKFCFVFRALTAVTMFDSYPLTQLKKRRLFCMGLSVFQS